MPIRRSAWLIASALGLLLHLPVGTSAQVLETVRVTMPDGTELATDIWRPVVDDGPRPVALRRTPYGRAYDMSAVTGFSSLGYILVSQDVRGRGDSDGTFSPFRDDAHDGADTMAWIAAQPWSNGRVGTFGGSAEGIVQLMAAGEAPPALQCVHATVATDDLYEALYPGGAWREELGTAWLQGLGEPEALVDFRAHETGDTFWDGARVDATERARIESSTLLVGGFFDIFAVGTPRTFRELRAAAPAADRTYMVLGPWTHGGFSVSTQGEVTYPADSAYLAYVEDLIAYLGWCLKDEARPTWAPVRYYVSQLADDGLSATGDWRAADDWPPPASPVALHLHADGALRADPPAADGAAAMLDVAPDDPVPSIGGGNLTTPAGPHDQRTVDARDDVLLVASAPATEEVEIIGDVRAHIVAASATTDVDVVVRLEQVTPSGAAMLLAQGVRRGRFVGGYDAIVPLVPGTPAVFEVDVGPIAIVLPPGHALRLALSGSSRPHFEACPNVADPIASATPTPTTLTLYRDAANASSLTLPVARGVLPGSVLTIPADGGAPTDGGVAEEEPGKDGGCGCRAVGAPARLNVELFAAALLAVALFARRRRHIRRAPRTI